MLIIFLVRFLHRTKNLAELAYILVGVLYIAVQYMPSKSLTIELLESKLI